ncbi:MAG: TldD/PmbA family protein [Firmicutes bacterium]|nr:TldD/PmbA family protein [Bacillota bacterium]
MNSSELCTDLIEQAVKMGAKDAEVFHIKSRTLEAVFEKNDLQVPKGDNYQGLGIRVHISGAGGVKQGFAATNVLSPDSLHSTLETALAIAKASPSDPYHWIPDPQPVKSVEAIYDSTAREMTLQDVVKEGAQLVDAARGCDSRITLDSARYAVDILEKTIVNSKGIHLKEKSSVFSCIGLGFARDGDDISSFDAEVAVKCHYSEIDPAQTGIRLAEKVISALGAAAVPSFRGSIIITPYAAEELVVDPIFFACNAQNVQSGRSKWANMLGAKVLSPLISITDDPTIPGAVGSTAFDREGVPPKTLAVIEEGVLNHYFYNSYTAQKDDTASNGRASGGDDSIPGISTTNLIVAPGEVSLNDMIASCSKGLLINRFSGNVDHVSGDFSGVVKGGQYIENGKIKHPVKEVMIAGNIYDLLKQVAAVSKEYIETEDAKLPYIQIEGCSVTGR